jgi:biopolymer transport protein ExbB
MNPANNRIGLILRITLLVILMTGVAAVIFVAMRGLSISPSTAQQAGLTSSPQAARTPTLFEQFVTSGGWIVWFILLPMSFATVYLGVFYGFTIRQKILAPAGIGDEIGKMASAISTKELVGTLEKQDDLVSASIAEAIRKGRDDWFRLREAFFESVQDRASRLLRTIEWANLIGNVSPMVGLFGTVVGMIELFGAIVTAGGQPQPVQLAHGISVALVTTFWGLLIAIPALSIYGIFRNRIEAIANEAISQGEDALLKIRAGIENRRRLGEAKQKQNIVGINVKSKTQNIEPSSANATEGRHRTQNAE